MNYSTNNISKIIALAVVLIILIVGFVLWEDYLRDHFVGAFDQYGLPSQFFRTGLPLMIDAWPIWVIPSVLLVLLVVTIERVFQHFSEINKQKLAKENEHQTVIIAETKGKNQIEFNRALEIEALKQQVEILKQKYFEEHRKSQDVARTIEEATLLTQLAQKEAAEAKAAAASNKSAKTLTSAPSNAHNEAVITSLKADNKKLQRQITELQEDLEQSNALIEKLLETQTG
jgi:hypothetical protein